MHAAQRLASLFLVAGLLTLAPLAYAQEQDRSYSRHNIAFAVGLLGEHTPGAHVQTGTVGTRTHVGGVSGGLHYDYRMSAQWAATLRWAVLDVQEQATVEVRGIRAGSSAGFALLFGAKYFPSVGDDLPIEPFLTLATGPYVHTDSGASISREGIYGGTRTASTLGLFAQVGADWYMNPWLKFQVGVGYHAVDNFDATAALANPSGPDFTLGMGVSFGR